MRDTRVGLNGRSLATRAAAAAVAGFLAAGGLSLAATTFQAAYLQGTSGPSSGGTATTVLGNQFLNGASVTVGGAAASGVVWVNGTRIRFTTPARSPGLHDVVVSNPGGATSTLPKAWFADFLDVPDTSAYHGAAEWMLRQGITSGCGSGSDYCPDNNIVRAEMAVFLVRAKWGGSFVPPPETGNVFADVPVGSIAARYIEQLWADGITTGCSAAPPGGLPSYCPLSNVTRGQMAIFLLRVLHGATYVPAPATGMFSDVPVGSTFAPWIEEFGRLYITSGCAVGLYCPDNPTTRGQMAIFMVRSFNRPAAARFLEQATWGPTDLEISGLLSSGYPNWLANQYAQPISLYQTMTPYPNDVDPSCNSDCQRLNYTMYPLYTHFFQNGLYQADQLRQRVFWALHKLVVVSGSTVTMPFKMTPYLQLLQVHAFGSWRTILELATLNPAMGRYLDMYTSTKNNPNENYAREILQLFSIGTDMLDLDGTVQVDGFGIAVPTYDQSVVDNFKKVFTGWYIPYDSATDISDYINPMPLNASKHDLTEKRLFEGFLPGWTLLPAGQTGDQDLPMAIDAIFNHPTMGPYLAKELIHGLVTSNPSPAYIERVAASFNNDGFSNRGLLWAVIQAVLLDPEARNAPSDPASGKLKDPAQYVLGFLRAFNAMSYNRTNYSDGYVNPQTSNMAMNTFRPPTVFSYYPQFYSAPPNLPFYTGGLAGPEFGIMDASTSLRRANFINTMLYSNVTGGGVYFGIINQLPNAPNGTSVDLTELKNMATNADNLCERLNHLLLRGQMSAAMRTEIVNAVNAITLSPTPTFTELMNRAKQAVYLVATSSQYQVQR